MIDLRPSRTFLDRFRRDLDAQAPDTLAEPPDLSLGTAEDAHAARLVWASRVVDEYRSVVVFGELLGHLAAIEAPFVVTCAVHRLIGDELRHAELCARVSAFFGPLEGLEIDLADLGLPPAADPAARALEIVARELVVAESESVRVMRAYRDAATDPSCRRALCILLTDEVRHAATGRALFDLLGTRAGGVAPELEETMAEDRAHIVATHASCARGGPGRVFGASIRAEEAPKLADSGFVSQ